MMEKILQYSLFSLFYYLKFENCPLECILIAQ